MTSERDSSPRIVTTEVLADLAAAGRDVVFVLAGAPDLNDVVTVLAGVRRLFPTSKRCLTLNWGDRSAAAAILDGFAGGDVDYWVPRPWSTPDESFHRAISEFLAEWGRLYRPNAEMVRVVGRDWDGPTHQLGDLLSRHGIPHGFADAGSAEGGGYLMTGRDAGSSTGRNRFETSIPGVYAVGDVRHGATKRVASSVGEGSVVIGSVHRYLTQLSAEDIPARSTAP